VPVPRQQITQDGCDWTLPRSTPSIWGSLAGLCAKGDPLAGIPVVVVDIPHPQLPYRSNAFPRVARNIEDHSMDRIPQFPPQAFVIGMAENFSLAMAVIFGHFFRLVGGGFTFLSGETVP
jgi:hypothetical protein